MDSLIDEPRPEDVVLDYHERTKHHFSRYAASSGYLDWATQPNPFRRFADAPLIRLPLPPVGEPLPYWKLYAPGAVAPAQLELTSISLFLRYALSLTAWKQIESSRWALRANPSSGNLHPTEGYLILPRVDGLSPEPAVYHYAPREHGLERRAELDDDAWHSLVHRFPRGSFVVGLSSIHWREAWKYGERAYRYCQHDVGHALGSLRMAAAASGWLLHLLDGTPDQATAGLLGLDRDGDYQGAEREEPDLLAIVTTEPSSPVSHPAIDEAAVRSVRGASWCGRANALSEHHVADWPIIDTAAEAAERYAPPCDAAVESFSSFPTDAALFGLRELSGSRSAEDVILGRRSAVAMDGVTELSAESFYRMLGRVVPRADATAAPWDAIPWRPRVHLALFVHRVTGLEPGLYALVRDPEKLETLRAAMNQDFSWERPASCPPGLPLFVLRAGDVRRRSAEVSCGQDIASDGAFSLGMLAELHAGIERFGASFYRRLFWEAGVVGQILYLESEESGIRATGIGCYFDDPVHETFGITGPEIQSLYHFTVGAPVEDGRLTTLPAYPSESIDND